MSHGRTVAVLLALLVAVGGGFYVTAGRWEPTPAAVVRAEEPRPPQSVPANTPRTFEGTVVRHAGGLALVDGGTTRPLVEDDGARMFAWDDRLRGRPVRLTAVPGAALRVIFVQTVKDGDVYDVDYWCEICQISMTFPGTCYCCGDPNVLRERPAR